MDKELVSNTALLDLLTFLSPSFPVGGYVYSHGIENAVEAGRIKNERDLCVWIKAILYSGAGRIDGGLFRLTWQAINEEDFEMLRRIIERGDILQGTAEIALESTSQGEAFLDAVYSIRDYEQIKITKKILLETERKITYAVATAVVLAAADVSIKASLLGYFHSFVSNLVSAGVRLIPLGQSAGQRCIDLLKPAIKIQAETSMRIDLEDLSTASPIIEIASMKHETQYTRLFRS